MHTDTLNNNDLHSLTPDPWDFTQRDQRAADTVFCQVTGPDGAAIFDTANSENMKIEDDSDEDGPHYYDSIGKANLRFCKIARNAFGILMRRGWTVKRIKAWGASASGTKRIDTGEVWVVCENAENGDDKNIVGPREAGLIWANDPFSVIVKVEKWFKDSVE
jgi:hypothetical protein